MNDPKTQLTLSEAEHDPPESWGLLAEDAEAAEVIAALIDAGRLEDVVGYVWPEVAT